ncbi:MAG: polyprenyl synthetase family protein [Lachnospiraceae bacterium]|jgi:geranylgeranyl diphosphate synthase type II|nr:polyprenyl synthetase family protein [Lachnospiraceae bacterium]MEE0513521.1 farnesyl diphosphate synthase [Lachnospiraceae bacterium]
MDRKKEVEQIVTSFLPKEEGYQKTVLEAMNYSVSAGGKRLRPMLMLETYRMFGGTSKVIEPFMAAIEMIHTYSLIHDDLPAMDNDEYRRGRKTTHVVYGEAMAILAGDALLNYAFETAASAFVLDEGNPAIGKAFMILASKAGVYGMIGGQVVDVESEGKEIDADTLKFIHIHKTSALLESAMLIGAVLAGASEQQQRTVELAARELGLAFQIRDDILDVTGNTDELGKPVGSDEKNHKNTYVALEGLEKAKEDVKRYSESAIDRLKSLPVRNEFLYELIEELIDRRS